MSDTAENGTPAAEKQIKPKKVTRVDFKDTEYLRELGFNVQETNKGWLASKDRLEGEDLFVLQTMYETTKTTKKQTQKVYVKTDAYHPNKVVIVIENL